MTLAQLEASSLTLPVPLDAAAFPAYRAECRRMEAQYEGELHAPLDLDDLDDLVEETQPAGPVYESPEWDLHFHRAACIEASYA